MTGSGKHCISVVVWYNNGTSCADRPRRVLWNKCRRGWFANTFPLGIIVWHKRHFWRAEWSKRRLFTSRVRDWFSRSCRKLILVNWFSLLIISLACKCNSKEIASDHLIKGEVLITFLIVHYRLASLRVSIEKIGFLNYKYESKYRSYNFVWLI